MASTPSSPQAQPPTEEEVLAYGLDKLFANAEHFGRGRSLRVPKPGQSWRKFPHWDEILPHLENRLLPKRLDDLRHSGIPDANEYYLLTAAVAKICPENQTESGQMPLFAVAHWPPGDPHPFGYIVLRKVPGEEPELYRIAPNWITPDFESATENIDLHRKQTL